MIFNDAKGGGNERSNRIVADRLSGSDRVKALVLLIGRVLLERHFYLEPSVAAYQACQESMSRGKKRRLKRSESGNPSIPLLLLPL